MDIHITINAEGPGEKYETIASTTIRTPTLTEAQLGHIGATLIEGAGQLVRRATQPDRDDLIRRVLDHLESVRPEDPGEAERGLRAREKAERLVNRLRAQGIAAAATDAGDGIAAVSLKDDAASRAALEQAGLRFDEDKPEQPQDVKA